MSQTPNDQSRLARLRGKLVTSQEANKSFRQSWPAWMKQLPRINFPPANPNYELIDSQQLDTILVDTNPVAAKRIRDDIEFMRHELMRLIREQDHTAAYEQNRYRMYQIGYIALATLATLFGSLQALAYSSGSSNAGTNYVSGNALVAFLALGETVVALAATFLATVSSREPPFNRWMTARRRAESLRREYFRYLVDMSPYDSVDGYKRRVMLSERAADINRGVFPTSEEDKS